MAKTKAQKQEVISKLESAMKNAVSTVFVHFAGVSVAEESAMRRDLRKQNVGYTVAKKTLIRRALDTLGHKHDDLPLEGEVAIAYVSAEASAKADSGSVDSTVASRLMHDFGKKLADKIVILGGIFEGKLVGQAQMQEIATIPPMDTLRAMFAQVINSPRQRFAVVLSKVAESKA